jgi:hypothetical protein
LDKLPRDSSHHSKEKMNINMCVEMSNFLSLIKILHSVINNEGKRLLGRPRHRWEDNIKMDLQEMGYWGMDWIKLAQDRDRWWAFVNVVMNLRLP